MSSTPIEVPIRDESIRLGQLLKLAGVVLGCTEITLLVGGDDATVPLFDTTANHIEDAVDWMLAGN